jgi:histidine phosphotransferase ChpT
MISAIKLIELMSARMFHDLAGPVGAMNNSIDFFEESDEIIKAKALQLLKTSSKEAILRLKFFRQAYGNAGGEEVSLQSIYDLVSEFLGSTRISLNWKVADVVVNSYIAKIILNIVIITLGAMIQGGELSITSSDNNLKITLESDALIFHEDTKSLLLGKSENIRLSSANIQIYYTHMIIQEAKASLNLMNNKRIVELSFSY